MTNNLYRFFALSSLIGYSMFLVSCAKKSLQIEYNGHIYIKTKIEDSICGNFIYDTGAKELILDTAFCKKNKLIFKTTQDTKIGGVGNSIQNAKIVLDTLTYKIDKKTNFSNKTILLGLKNILGQNTDGILGVNSFKNRPHKIDFINKKISFFKNTKNYDSINLIFDGDKIYVPVTYTINEEEYIGKFILDLGSSVTVLNSSNKINTRNRGDFESIGGIGGKTAGKTIFINQFKLGNQSINNFPIDISNDSKGALSSSEYDGILGNDILDDFDLIIDIKKSKLFLKPNKKINKHKKFFYKSFSFIDNSKIDKSWLVSYIYLNTDAYKKGLRLNDKITAINNISVEKLDRIKYYKGLKLNQELELTIIRDDNSMKINIILNPLGEIK